MDNEDPIEPLETDIPEDFYNTMTQTRFETCTICHRPLEDEVTYVVEKAFKKVNSGVTHTLFEYAICMECASEFNQKMSSESQSALRLFMWQNANLGKNQRRAFEGDTDYRNWVSECMINGSSREELTEYNLCGMFRGDKMLLNEFPYMLSLEAMEEMQELLSAETKDELDNFKRQHLGGPPELEELFKTRPVVAV